MKVYSEKEKIQEALGGLRTKRLSIGLVPTMGALHQGHLQLVKRALKENDYVVVSIFVNPTQFDNNDDLIKYPRNLEADTELLETLDKSRILVYAPTVDDMYSGNTVAEEYDFDGLEFEMEGKFRTGHFDGVGTIVSRFFDIVQPDRAYFGEKDFQQLAIIQKLVRKYDIPVKVVGCEIYREPSGLAMSSRNTRLEPKYREAAPFIYKTLTTAKELFGIKSAKDISEWVENQFANNELLNLEYFIIADAETLKPIKEKVENIKYRAFIAAYAGDIRLIDNIALN